MSRTIISEGKTTNEAIENGLKELNVNKNQVEVKVLDQEKKSFFNILAPRVVKVEITVKEESVSTEKKSQKVEICEEDLLKIKESLEKFLDEFLNKVDSSFKYDVEINNSDIMVNVIGEDSGTLIGHRGETLNSLQAILTAIANKNTAKRARIYLNIDNYKEKRQKTLEELATKVSKTVLRTGKSITLEPMNAYERKVIHTKLQENKEVRTHSIGEEPNRRIVIEKI